MAGRGVAARRAGWLLIVAWLATWSLWPQMQVIGVSVAMMAATVGGVLLHGSAARRATGRARLVWALGAIGLACWAVVEIVVGIASIRLGHHWLRPLWADVVNLGALVFAMAAMLTVPSAPTTRTGRLRLMLDAALIASATLGTVWMLIVPALLSRMSSMVDTVLELAYPILGMGALVIALIVFAGQPRWRGSALTYISGGIATIAATLLVEVFADAAGVTSIAVWVQGGLLVSGVLLAVAPLAHLPTGSERSWDSSTLLGRMLPYVPVVAYTAVAVVVTSRGDVPDPPAVWAGVVMIGCVLGRQFLTVELNAQLTRTLRRERAALAHEVLHDSLTGLPNRAMLHDRMSRLDESRADGEGPALLMIDLDGFKSVNDTLGHAVGDELLAVVADRLRAVTDGAEALPARLGGDEFAVLVSGGRGEAIDLAERVLAALSAPVPLAGRAVTVRASIGVAVDADPRADSRGLLRQADLALYQAKGHGKGCYREYHPDLSADVHRRRELEFELSNAIDGGQLELAYQPIVDLRTSAVLGLEALVRWRHPRRGPLDPDEFLPTAEATGLLPAMDHWVLGHACAQAGLWRRVLRPDIAISVNVSAAYLATGRVVDDVTRNLATTGLAAHALTVEVSETGLLSDLAAAARTLTALRRLGVRIAMDGFGVGYSSLAYLNQLPVDTVKIDKSFVRDLAEDAAGTQIMKMIIALARRMNLDTVVEGVEDAAQARRLADLGCDRAQGDHFARPMPAHRVTDLLTADAGRPAGVAA